jgi:hypothetical protein
LLRYYGDRFVPVVPIVQWFDRSRSLTAGFRRPSVPSPSRNHHDRPDLPLILSVVEGFAPFKTSEQ